MGAVQSTRTARSARPRGKRAQAARLPVRLNWLRLRILSNRRSVGFDERHDPRRSGAGLVVLQPRDDISTRGLTGKPRSNASPSARKSLRLQGQLLGHKCEDVAVLPRVHPECPQPERHRVAYRRGKSGAAVRPCSAPISTRGDESSRVRLSGGQPAAGARVIDQTITQVRFVAHDSPHVFLNAADIVPTQRRISPNGF